MPRAWGARLRCWKPETVACGSGNYSLPSFKFPNQTPKILLSYVSKDVAEGEEDCRILALRVTPATGPLGSTKWLPKHAAPGISLTSRVGEVRSKPVRNSSAASQEIFTEITILPKWEAFSMVA